MRETRQKELLYELRKKMQGAFHVEPYKILPDKVIETIINEQPTTLSKLKKIKGLPEEGFRANKFGEAIVAIITKWSVIDGLELKGNNEDGYTIDLSIKPMSVF